MRRLGDGPAGAPLRREGPEKLTGLAKYADDLVFPGAWYGATIRSTEPHARLLGIDLDDGFDWSRVVVVTADDIPGENVVSLIDDDQPVLVPVGGEIRHQAEPVALIAAADRSTVREARRHISLRTERLAPVFDPLDSEHQFAHYTVERGDAAAAMAQAHLVIEGTYRVGHQEQLYIENQAMIAVPREDGGITVHGSLQCPYYIHKAMKRALKMGDELAVVVQAETGGGFGGKEEYPSMIALHAALLALKCGKPVRMIYDRHEDISATTKRHPAVVRYRSGVTSDGELVAQEIEVIMDGGAYCTLTPVVLSRGTLHAGGPYRCENVRITGRAMATNTPPNGAFRGFGAPQTEFAAEMQVNRIAEALGESPLELRRRWVYVEGDTTPTGQVLRESVGGEAVLEAAAEASAFETHRQRTREAREMRGGGARRASGIGLALAWHGAGFTGSGEVHLASVASVELTDDHRIRILTASTEMGQGTKTIFPQLVADTLGVEYDEVEIAPQDTSIVPDSGPTVASRTAMVVGGLLIRASERLRAAGGGGDRPQLRRRLSRGAATARGRAVHAVSGRHVRRQDLHRRRLPGLRLGRRRGSRRGRPGHGRGHGARVRGGRRHRARHPPRAGGGPGGGWLAAGHRLRHHRGDEAGRRPLSERSAGDLPDPDRARRPAHPQHPGREAVLRRAPRRQGGRRAAHGRRGAGGGGRHPRRDRHLDPRPARHAGANPRRPDRWTDASAPGGIGRTARPEGPADRGPARRRRRDPAPLPHRPAAGLHPVTCRFNVNGSPVEVDAPGMRRLLDVLREDLALTGTKEGCGEGECGACSVLIDGALVDACLVPVCQVEGASVDTVEGLADDGALNGLQAAFLETGGAQCGICTPGMLMAGEAFLASGEAPKRRGDPPRHRRQPVPLHRLHQDHRRHRPRRRPARRPRSLMPPEPPVVSPRTLAEAYQVLAAIPHRPVAGGTDLLVQITGEIGEPPERVMDLWGLDDLRGIRVDGDVLVIGALTTYTQIRRSHEVAEFLPSLAEAAATIGAAQIQNRGTLGGNAANASPAGDTLPILLAADAELVLGSGRGERTVPAAEFWPSYRQTALAPDELILRIRFPLAGQRRVRFRKVGTRRAQAISKVVMALAWQPGPGGNVARGAAGARLGGGDAGPRPAHRSGAGRCLSDRRDGRPGGGRAA